MIERFGRRHQVGLLAFSDPRATPGAEEEVRPLCWFLKAIPKDIYHLPRRARLASLLTPVPSWFLQTDSAAMRSSLREEIANRAPDVVQIEFLGMAHYVDGISHPRVVLNIHEAFGRTWLRRALEYRRSPLLPYVLWDHRKLARRERELIGRFRAVLALSEEDRRYLLAANPGAPVRHWSPGICPAPARVGPGPRGDEGGRLLFVGSFSHGPNVDAVRFFCRRILPGVRGRQPGVVLDIVGAEPPAAVLALRGERVFVHGYVEDLNPFYEKADVVVVPVRFGGGVRIKLLEALARGVPVVSTVVGAEGIRGLDGEHLFVARDAEAFASRVHRLLSDPGLRRAMGRKARELAEGEHGWPKAVERLEAFYEEILGAAPGQAGGRRGPLLL